MKRWIIYSIIGLAAVACLGVFFILRSEKYGLVRGKAVDALSGDAVREIRIVLGGKSITMYTSKFYHLTEIKPGTYPLRATAPNYYDFEKDIEIKKGENILDILMKGKEIPDLKSIIVWAEPVDKGIELEIRFVDSKGHGITNFPCLPLKLEGKLFVRLGSEEKKYFKGRKIFEGPIELFWDSKAFLGKNKGIIPWDKIKVDKKIEKYGIMEVVLHTSQGDFEDKSDEVKLFKEE